MTFKRIAKPGEPLKLTRQQRESRAFNCNHVRPRRCCIGCRNFYIQHHGDEAKGLLQFNQAIDLYARRPVREA